MIVVQVPKWRRRRGRRGRRWRQWRRRRRRSAEEAAAEARSCCWAASEGYLSPCSIPLFPAPICEMASALSPLPPRRTDTLHYLQRRPTSKVSALHYPLAQRADAAAEALRRTPPRARTAAASAPSACMSPDTGLAAAAVGIVSQTSSSTPRCFTPLVSGERGTNRERFIANT